MFIALEAVNSSSLPVPHLPKQFSLPAPGEVIKQYSSQSDVTEGTNHKLSSDLALLKQVRLRISLDRTVSTCAAQSVLHSNYVITPSALPSLGTASFDICPRTAGMFVGVGGETFGSEFGSGTGVYASPASIL